MIERNGTAITYGRVSGEEQARRGYSLPDQREALRKWCEQEGYAILDHVADEGWSGAYLERPGLDRVRDLVAAGGVDVVVVLFRDRLARGVQAGLLAEEFKAHGVRLVALNAQTDDSPEGDLQGGLLDLFSAYERSVFRRRSQRGIARSVRQGNVIRGPKAPYGFAATEDGRGLLVHEPEMRVLRRIFRDMAAGKSAGTLVRELEAGGVPGPSGIARWNKKTIAHFLSNDLCRPHAAGEVAEMVEPGVAAALDPGRVYGLWTWNRRKTGSRKERDGGGIVTRYSSEPRPREEWIVVPVDITDAGLSRAVVDRAREGARDRYREPSGASDRTWQVRGIAKCVECGSVLSPHTVTRPRKNGTVARNAYYQCRRRYNNGPTTCDHTTSYPAAVLEQAVWEAILSVISDPDRLRRQHDQYVERVRREMRGDPDREARELAEQLKKLDRRRSAYIDLAADEAISREDLRDKLAELETRRKDLEEALRSARNRHKSIEDAERAWGMAAQVLDLDRISYTTASPEDRRRLYLALGLRADVERDGAVVLSGVFDSGIRLLDALRDGPDVTTPWPGVGGRHEVFVASGNTPSRT